MGGGARRRLEKKAKDKEDIRKGKVPRPIVGVPFSHGDGPMTFAKRFGGRVWGGEATGQDHAKLFFGHQCLSDDTKHDEVEKEKLNEYMSIIVYRTLAATGLTGALLAMKRWPRIRPHWSRIRRRICDTCGKQVALSEPRFLVCGGCGVARYCCERCQERDWPHHQKWCAELAVAFGKGDPVHLIDVCLG